MKNSLSNKNSPNVTATNRQSSSQHNPMTGKHILAEFWQCQCDPQLLTSSQPLLGLLSEAVEQAGLTLVGHAVHEFEQHVGEGEGQGVGINGSKANLQQLSQAQTSGVTLTLLLAESHLCLHTWGEYQTVTLDVYVCNVAHENSAKADALFNACLQLFKPNQHHVNTVSRQHQIPYNSQH